MNTSAIKSGENKICEIFRFVISFGAGINPNIPPTFAKNILTSDCQIKTASICQKCPHWSAEERSINKMFWMLKNSLIWSNLMLYCSEEKLRKMRRRKWIKQLFFQGHFFAKNCEEFHFPFLPNRHNFIQPTLHIIQYKNQVAFCWRIICWEAREMENKKIGSVAPVLKQNR